jgi:hypothetical protein
MDAKSKFREAVRSCNEAADAVVKSDDRSKREVLEQIRALYYRLASCLQNTCEGEVPSKQGHSNEKPGGYWQRAETILGTPSRCLNSALRRSLPVEPVAAQHSSPNVMCDLAHVCQLDGCAQRLGSAKHQRMLAPPDCF